MRLLYIVFSEPITPNGRGGDSAIFHEQLMALADLGAEITLWHHTTGESGPAFHAWRQDEPEVWQNVRDRCARVYLTDSNLDAELRHCIRKFDPHCIWAQHYQPARLAAAQHSVPVVYSHHDWQFRIKELRYGRPEEIRHKLSELDLVRQVAAAVSGSAVECEQIRNAGCGNVHYIPVSYDPVPIDWSRGAPQPRLIHLGGMGATANLYGLTRFLEVVWPELKGDGLDLEIIGDVSTVSAPGAPPQLSELLTRVKCSGFVRDLGTTLRPGDIQLIPWEHNTGQRTRLPLAFNHGQVVIAMRNAVACYPEAVDRVNCRLVDGLDQMASAIREVAADTGQRYRLARAAKSTFEDYFTRSGLLPRYAEVVRSISHNESRGEKLVR